MNVEISLPELAKFMFRIPKIVMKAVAIFHDSER